MSGSNWKGRRVEKLIAGREVVGDATNPTTFAAALAGGEAYD